MKVRRVTRFTPSTAPPPPAEMPAKTVGLAPEIAQMIDLVAEILLEQRRKEAEQQSPVEAA